MRNTIELVTIEDFKNEMLPVLRELAEIKSYVGKVAPRQYYRNKDLKDIFGFSDNNISKLSTTNNEGKILKVTNGLPEWQDIDIKEEEIYFKTKSSNEVLINNCFLKTGFNSITNIKSCLYFSKILNQVFTALKPELLFLHQSSKLSKITTEPFGKS